MGDLTLRYIFVIYDVVHLVLRYFFTQIKVFKRIFWMFQGLACFCFLKFTNDDEWVGQGVRNTIHEHSLRIEMDEVFFHSV